MNKLKFGPVTSWNLELRAFAKYRSGNLGMGTEWGTTIAIKVQAFPSLLTTFYPAL